MTDQRRHPRQPGPFEGSWSGSSGDLQCQITGLSPGGCFVDSPAKPAPGASITVTVLFRDTRFSLPGEVVYLDRLQGFGVRFLPSNQSRTLAYAMGLSTPSGPAL